MKPKVAILISLVLLIGPAAVAAQEPAFDSPAQTEPFALHQTTLPNGLRLWVQPRPGSESAVALLVLRAGARHETPANR